MKIRFGTLFCAVAGSWLAVPLVLFASGEVGGTADRAAFFTIVIAALYLSRRVGLISE